MSGTLMAGIGIALLFWMVTLLIAQGSGPAAPARVQAATPTRAITSSEWESPPLTTVQSQPVQAQPVQRQPVQAQPVQTPPMQSQPVQSAAAPVRSQPVQTVQAQPAQPRAAPMPAPPPRAPVSLCSPADEKAGLCKPRQ